MKSSLSNLKEQEAIHGKWELPPSNVQIESEVNIESDPICSSAGCTQYKHPEVKGHPMDYPVPDFGEDHDIKSSISNEKIASKIVGHDWKWEKAPDGPPKNYFVPDFGVD